MKSRVILLLASICLVASTPRLLGRQSKKYFTELQTEGSVPPVPHLFDCIRNLEGEVYDPGKAQACLNSILDSGYIERGRIDLKPTGPNELIQFVLKALPLKLTELDFGIPPGTLSQLRSLLSVNRNVLQPGYIYDFWRETATQTVMDILSRSRGERVGISRELLLDYDKGTARLLYHVWSGPTARKEAPLPPYGKGCDIYVGNFNEMDVDDFTPLALVNRITMTYRGTCFSEEATQTDEKRLLATGLFREARYTASGSGEFRTVALRLRAKPIRIEEVAVVGHGLLTGNAFRDVSNLPLKAGGIFLRSRSDAVCNVLVESYHKPDERLTVFEEINAKGNGGISLTFHVLAYPEDQLLMNGENIKAQRTELVSACAELEF